jgi:hypothetical protein
MACGTFSGMRSISWARFLAASAFLPAPAAHRHAAFRLKVNSTSWCRIPLPPLTSPRSRMTQYVPLLMRANFAP